MADLAMEENNYRYLMIRMKDPSNHGLINKIGKAIDKATPPAVRINLTYKQVSSSGSITSIVDYIFYLTIAVMMIGSLSGGQAMYLHIGIFGDRQCVGKIDKLHRQRPVSSP